MASMYMYGLSPSWSAETIALLLNKTQSSSSQSLTAKANQDGVHVQTLSTVDDKGHAVARVTFCSGIQLHQTLQSYHGLAIPMTHGYHYYSFSLEWPPPFSVKDEDGDTPWWREAPSPPLHLQLMAVPTDELERRLQYQCNDAIQVHCGKAPKKRSGRVHHHARLARELSQVWGQSRPCLEIQGVPLASTLTEPILTYLRSCTSLWPPRTKQRKGVQSGRYLTLRQSHPAHHDKLWNLCRDLIQSVAPDARYTALAITQAFVGSPHVDAHDTTFQHVVAVGDFTGGHLCADEDGCDDGPRVVTKINVHNRLGRLDGRRVHWVDGWKGERFSVVYYSTSRDDFTEPQCQSVHNEWMSSFSLLHKNSYGV